MKSHLHFWISILSNRKASHSLGGKTATACLNMPVFLIIILCTAANLLAQPAIEWDKSIAGPVASFLYSSQQTADGGYILGGYSGSGIGFDKTDPEIGFGGYWIVKLSATGVKEWDRTYGGPWGGLLVSVRQTTDGGYILGGYSTSDAGGDKTENYRGGYDQEGNRYSDFWIVKIAADGTKQWDKTLGGSGYEELNSIDQTADGGYIIGGVSNSGVEFDKTSPVIGRYDLWVVKLDSNGAKQWDKTFGESGFDEKCIVKQTIDGGYVVGGLIEVFQSIRGADYVIIRISADGTKLWEKVLGGSGRDVFTSIETTEDSGFLVGGYSDTNADGDKSEESQVSPSDETLRMRDYWVLKLTSTGAIVWDRTIGGLMFDAGGYYTGESYLASTCQTSDGGYILGGYSNAQKGRSKSQSNKGGEDYWVVKIDANGNYVWDTTIGGNGSDQLQSILQTTDGGYFLAGISRSAMSGDKTENKRGEADFWVVKLAPEPALPVTLTSFTAIEESQTAVLTWQTASETRSERFEVQHSINGKLWNSLATLNAKGESSALQSYQYVHTSPAAGENLYRLKMIDTDGTFTYSKIESLHYDSDVKVNIFPNPAAEILTIESSDWKNMKSVQLLNSSSVEVYASYLTPSRNVDVKNLPSGLYFVKLTRQDGTSVIQKVIVAR